MPVVPQRPWWPAIAALAAFACLPPTGTGAQSTLPADDPIPDYSGTASYSLTVNPDGSSEEVESRRITILAESAVKPQGKQSFGFTASLDRLEVLEAMTEKADGRKISVQPSAIVTQDSRLGSDIEESLDTHDMKQKIIIFRDVSVGDSVVATVRKSSRSAFPGQYISTIPVDEKLTPSFTITFNRSRPLYIGKQGNGFSHTVSANGSLRDYEELGRAMWAAWSPRLALTPEIRTLGEEITRGISDKRAQAEAIDRWVKRNIRYAWMSNGIEALLPDPVEIVLSNRYGHCANRAALMSVLLATRDIESEFVLIKKLGLQFSLPGVAAYAFDHALLYLPEFQIYADPTPVRAAFGVLDEEEYDKPVVHFSSKGARVDRTPAMRPGDHSLSYRTTMTVAAGGTISGQTTETTTGLFATYSRKFAVALPAKGSRKQAAEQLRKNETPGKGEFETGAADDLAEPFVIQSRFTLTKPIETNADKTWLLPAGLMPKNSPNDKDSPDEIFFGERYENRQHPFWCTAGRYALKLEVSFAQGLPLPRPLKGLTIKTSVFSYSSVYRLENRTLKLTREFVSHPPSQICPPATETVIASPLKAVGEDLEREISFAAARRTSSRDPKRKAKQPASALQRPSSGRG